MSKKYGVNPSIPICFWCGKQRNEIILFGKLGGRGEDLEAPRNCICDFEPCDECKETWKLGVTLIETSKWPVDIGIPQIQNGSYPTGNWSVIKKEAAERVFSDDLDETGIVLLDEDYYGIILGGQSA